MAVQRPITPRAAGAAVDALKKFDAASSVGGMVPLAAEGRSSCSSVPIGLGLHLLRPMSGSRSHAPAFPSLPQSSLAVGVVQAGRPVTPKGPLTALVAQQSAAAAAAAAAATAGSISLIQVRSGGAVLFFFVALAAWLFC